MITHEEHKAPLLKEAMDMQKRGLDFENIRQNLAAQLSDTAELNEIMKSLKEHHYAIRRRRGTLLAIIGAILLVFGCIAVLAMHDIGGATRMAIYLPSIIGSGLVLWGLVDVLGW
jgi:hypothetical protein